MSASQLKGLRRRIGRAKGITRDEVDIGRACVNYQLTEECRHADH